ncbi:MAG: NUDIX hydrolase [Candidatus Korobacteraceae bacterium]
MKRDYPERPFVGAGAVIVKRDAQGNRVLLVQRGNEPLKGKWTIPGGMVELGETLRECAIREAREETGLIVETGEVLEVVDSIVTGPDGGTQYHYVLVDFLCKVVGGELLAGGDAADVCWVSESNLAERELSPVATRVIGKAFASDSVQNPIRLQT